MPDDADIDMHREWLLIRPRSTGPSADVTHPAGSLLAARFDDFLAGARELTVLFTPGRADLAAATRAGPATT